MVKKMNATAAGPTFASTHMALGHALLSYAFGTGVIAVTINMIANL